MGRRVLVTGLGTYWGGRVAQALEADDNVEMIVGVGVEEPNVELTRTEYVKADSSYSILARIVQATQVDTILHTFLALDSNRMSSRQLHEINVIGTMNLLAACSAADSPVRTVVVKSSTLIYGSNFRDPAWFVEESTRTRAPRTAVESSLLEVEGYLRDFAEDNPHVSVTLLRFANVLGTEIVTPISKALNLPAAPSILGFDPLMQFVEENDVVRSIEFVMRNELPGVYNVAGDGKLPWSEVISICGRPTVPMSPFFTVPLLTPLNRFNLLDFPPEMMDLLRYGRGVDNRRLKRAGFSYRFTSAGAVEQYAAAVRLRNTVGDHEPTYRYERDVENFFQHSPAVVRES
ncbi:MAG: NAD-dependent epimerase/dehydratase family protein [Acidimicrobiales bacterium]